VGSIPSVRPSDALPWCDNPRFNPSNQLANIALNVRL